MSRGGGGHSRLHSHSSHRSHHSHRSSSHSSSGSRGFSSGGTHVGSHHYHRSGHTTMTFVGGRGYINGREMTPEEYVYYQKQSNWIVVGVLAVFAIVFLMPFLMMGLANRIPNSTVDREKIVGSNWNNSCVFNDSAKLEINEATVSKNIRKFYNDTGIQPWFYAVAMNSSTDTDAKREAFADAYYKEHINNEDTLLWVFFDSPYTDECYSSLIFGNNINTVMDAEAENIFWAYWDKYFSSNDTDDQFVIHVFNSTSDRIMSKTVTIFDFGKILAISVILIITICGTILIIKTVHKHNRERNAETDRILRTTSNDAGIQPTLNSLGEPASEDDDLL